MTRVWNRFIESLDGGLREWVNSVDRAALAALKGDERERAIALLINRLSIGSQKVARALGVLPDPRGRKALEAHLHVAKGGDKVATASALLEIGVSSPSAMRAIEEGLHDPDLGVANEALKVAPVAGKAILPALLAAGVSHPRENIRVRAIKMALNLQGLTETPLSWDHRDEILGLTRGNTPEQRRAAFASLCGLLGIDPQTYQGLRP